MFGFNGTFGRKPRKFGYTPVYYDPAAEKRAHRREQLRACSVVMGEEKGRAEKQSDGGVAGVPKPTGKYADNHAEMEQKRAVNQGTSEGAYIPGSLLNRHSAAGLEKEISRLTQKRAASRRKMMGFVVLLLVATGVLIIL